MSSPINDKLSHPPQIAPSTESITTPPAKEHDQKCGAGDEKCKQECGVGNRKCNTECGAGGGKCKQESCKCDTSCKCKSKKEQLNNNLKPIDCKSSNSEDCTNDSCTLSKPSDPIEGGSTISSKCQASTVCEGLEKQQCKEGENKKECENKKICKDKKECQQLGTCEGPKKDTSIVVWHPNQGSPRGSPRSQTTEQKGETHLQKEELKPCAHPPKDNVHKQEDHQKLCSPLPQGDKLKAILFDIDGTIADSDPIHFLAFQEVLAEVGYNGGVPISHEFFIRQMSGKLNYVIAEELMPEMEEKKRVEMMDEKEARYRKLAAKDLQPIPGFHQFAEYVKKRGLRRAAVTNSPRLNAEQVISALKIPDFFEIVVVGSECDNPKPFPDPYLKAIKFLGVEPNQCFVLEDSPSGIKAGRAAGSPVVGLLTGHPGPVLRDNGASVLIKDYHDSALWTALGEEACAGNSCSQSHDSTPATGVPPPIPVST